MNRQVLQYHLQSRLFVRDNTIDVYLGDEYEDVLADGAWETLFTEKPEPFIHYTTRS